MVGFIILGRWFFTLDRQCLDEDLAIVLLSIGEMWL